MIYDVVIASLTHARGNQIYQGSINQNQMMFKDNMGLYRMNIVKDLM